MLFTFLPSHAPVPHSFIHRKKKTRLLRSPGYSSHRSRTLLRTSREDRPRGIFFSQQPEHNSLDKFGYTRARSVIPTHAFHANAADTHFPCGSALVPQCLPCACRPERAVEHFSRLDYAGNHGHATSCASFADSGQRRRRRRRRRSGKQNRNTPRGWIRLAPKGTPVRDHGESYMARAQLHDAPALVQRGSRYQPERLTAGGYSRLLYDCCVESRLNKSRIVYDDSPQRALPEVL